MKCEKKKKKGRDPNMVIDIKYVMISAISLLSSQVPVDNLIGKNGKLIYSWGLIDLLGSCQN